MNEEQKNIETCLAENILSEVANVPTDPQFVSLTDEALDPLKQQALQQAGYDGYKEVVMYHQPYTFTSQVKQMKSNLILLLRRLWRFPFGRGTTASSDAGSASTSAAGTTAASAAAPIRSIADMWQHYITRLKGNPEYGIPSRLSSLTDLPSAPALLADRKISGIPEAADGLSILHLIGNTNVANSITILDDPNRGYVWNRERFNINILLMNMLFPNLQEVHIGCGRNTQAIFEQNTNIQKIVFEEMVENDAAPFWITSYDGGFQNLTEVSFPKLKVGGSLIYWNLSGWWNKGLLGLTTLNLPELETIKSGEAIGKAFISGTMPSLEILNMPKLKTLNSYLWGGNTLSGLKELHMPSLTHCNSPFTNTTYAGSPADLILVEVGAVDTNIDIRYWSPTNVLADADKTATFLQNFRDYIANRLTDKVTGLTITLSQEVRNAIHAAEGEYGIENIIITQKGWTISPAPN